MSVTRSTPLGLVGGIYNFSFSSKTEIMKLVESLVVKAFRFPPKFSVPFSMSSLVRLWVPLKLRCSRKWAEPEVSKVSYLDPDFAVTLILSHKNQYAT